MCFELSSLIAWINLLIEKTYSGFKVNIFSINSDITKCQFLHNYDRQYRRQGYAAAVPQIFSKNSLAEKEKLFLKNNVDSRSYCRPCEV